MNNRLATDDAFRAQIREMHANQAPLVDMVEALGLTPQMSGDIRSILQGLDQAQVDGIRAATLAMLDDGGKAMPLDCDIPQSSPDPGTHVAISVVDKGGKQTIQVRAT